MNKYIVIIFLHFTLLSCSNHRPVIQTQKKYAAVVKTANSTKKSASTSKKNTVSTRSKSSRAIINKTNQKDTVKAPATEIIVSTSKTKVTLATIQNYILQYKDIAMNNMRTNGIPASIILAQAILESGAGSGTLAQNANNHFGIKCHKEWTGESVRHDDDAPQECFRKYANPAESFQDHAIFLSSRGRYSTLFKLSKSDYRSWARGLREAGYATDPQYPEKLVTYIQRYNLDQYDNIVLGINDVSSTKDAVNDVLNSIPIVDNTGNTHQVQKGDTFYSLSKKYNLSVEELKEKNGLTENNLFIGQILKVK